jgi:hypothetical protein
MTDNRIEIAAENNAYLCDAVLRAQRQETKFGEGYWHCLGPGLPYYPAIVSLTSSPTAALSMALVNLPSGASVKDSFCSLDLDRQGFVKLFEATWLCRPRMGTAPSSAEAVIQDPDQLARWVAAWDDSQPDIFAPLILQHSNVNIIANFEADRVDSGAIVNHGPDGIAGISNVFGPNNGASILNNVVQRYGFLDLVGYESEAAQIDCYLSFGFEPIGKLAIYLKE